MKLSQGEKLILLALASKEDGKEELDFDFIRKAILSGNTWALSWELSGIPTDDTSDEIAEETASILTMWSYLEFCVEELSSEEREKLEKSAYPFNLKFAGFDANHDKHYGVVSFLVNKMDRFEEFKNRPLNSHSSSELHHYRKILPIYQQELLAQGAGSRRLSPDSILKIVRAGR